MDRLNARIRSLTPYQPGKPVEEVTRELGIAEVVKLASNENPRGPSERVREALGAAMDGLSRYPDGSGYRLKRALAAHHGVDPDRITLGNGSNDVLELIARVAISPGTEGIVAEHAFVVYPLAVISAGGELITVPARNWGADVEATLAAVNERTRIVFVANPNNPTGTWLDGDAVTTLLAGVPNDVVVVLDEAYFDYVDAPGYPDGVTLLDRYPNLVVTRTFSKVHALAALRVGYALSSPALADLMNRARQPFNVNSMALAAAEAALGDTDYVAESARLNRTGLAGLTRALTERGFDVIPSAGNFLAFDTGRDAAPVFEALLRAGVIVRPIAGYGMPRHLRVTVGATAENEKFLAALDKVL